MQVQTETFSRRCSGRGINEDTFKEYVLWVGRFAEWAEAMGYDGIDIGTLIEYDEALMDPPAPGVEHRDDPYSYSSRTKALSAVKKYGEKVMGTELNSDVNDIAKGEPAEFDPYIYTPEQVEDALTADCGCSGCLAARALGYDTIMRASEVTKVRPEDIDFENRMVYVRASKGSESRHIEVGDRAWQLVTDQYDRVHDRFDDPAKLFYNTTDRNSWSPNSWSEHFRRHHAPEVPGETTGFHSFARHTKITRMLQSGSAFGEVYLRARHSNPQMTSRYARIAGVGMPDDGLFSD